MGVCVRECVRACACACVLLLGLSITVFVMNCYIHVNGLSVVICNCSDFRLNGNVSCALGVHKV